MLKRHALSRRFRKIGNRLSKHYHDSAFVCYKCQTDERANAMTASFGGKTAVFPATPEHNFAKAIAKTLIRIWMHMCA